MVMTKTIVTAALMDPARAAVRTRLIGAEFPSDVAIGLVDSVVEDTTK